LKTGDTPHRLLTMDWDPTPRARRIAEGREASLFASHVKALAESLGVACAFVAEALPGGRLARTLAVSVEGRAFPGFVYSLDDLPCREVLEGGAACHASGTWEQFAVGTALGMPEIESYVGVRVPLPGERRVWMAVLDGKPLEDAQLTESILRLRATAASAEVQGRPVPPDVQEAQAQIEGTARSRSAALRAAHAALRFEAHERSRAETAFRFSEEKFVKAFRSNPSAVAIRRLPDGRLLEVNDAFLHCVGLKRGRVIGRTPEEIGIGPSTEETRELQALLETEGSVRNREIDYRTAAGAVKHLLLSAERIRLDGEDCVITSAIDITDRKRAETALRKSEERYAIAALGASDGLWDWDLETNEMYTSDRFREMLGNPARSISRPREWFSRVHPSDRDRLGMEIVAHLEGLTAHFESEHRLQHEGGTWRWMLCRGLAVRDAEGHAYRFAGSFTDITERKLLEQQVFHDAFHDALTGLPNRALFMDRAGRAVERSKRNPDYAFAVLVVDLDRFKVVNDGLGYRVGDELIRDTAHRIARCLRPEDTVARLGGDEFALLLEDLTDVSDATRVAARIADALQVPSGPQQLVTSASVGITLSSSGYESADDLLRDADIALHRAKAAGRARYEIFDAAMHRRALALLEMDLRRGLERNEFLVCYQPIVAFGTGRLAGFEALLRWRHPGRGLVLPADFVEVAEETGLIVSLGEWILREACRQAAEWTRRFGVALPVSVNLSGRQLTEPDVVERVARILEEVALPGHLLGLEVTESVLMANLDSAAEKLRRLKAFGVRVAIDDFGTGYSSFSLLHRFPIDTLKLDRSFVSRIPGPGSPTVRAIVALAHNLGMQVVAEGVETGPQRESLAALECAFGQGHLFSEAVPPERAAELIVTSPQW
jgi:diguanylate cyclase (GGDEF)-like protein/PAS domain S-box-containing protein